MSCKALQGGVLNFPFIYIGVLQIALGDELISSKGGFNMCLH